MRTLIAILLLITLTGLPLILFASFLIKHVILIGVLIAYVLIWLAKELCF